MYNSLNLSNNGSRGRKSLVLRKFIKRFQVFKITYNQYKET